MNTYEVYPNTQEVDFKCCIVTATKYRFIREKGGFCRFEFVGDNDELVATFNASVISAILKVDRGAIK